MLPTKLFWSLLVTGLVALSFTNCGDDGGCRPGAPCRCSGAHGCVYNCPDAGCRPTCSDVDFCTASCGGDCGYTCSRVSDCEVSCAGGCDAACIDVSSCEAWVGPDSTVSCERLSNCNVTCDGPCRVICDNVGACNVQCSDGSATECGDGTRVCGQSC